MRITKNSLNTLSLSLFLLFCMNQNSTAQDCSASQPIQNQDGSYTSCSETNWQPCNYGGEFCNTANQGNCPGLKNVCWYDESMKKSSKPERKAKIRD